MRNLPAHRSKIELRAPKTADIRGGRDSPAAGLQSTLCAKLKWGKGNQGHNFPLPETSLKAGSLASTDPCEGSPAPSPRIDSQREKKGNRQPEQTLNLSFDVMLKLRASFPTRKMLPLFP
jgi:hypothetical protein